MKICAVCGEEIPSGESYLKVCDNYLQVNFFEELDGSDNVFCSEECLKKALSVTEIEVLQEEGIDDKTMNDKRLFRLRHTVTNDEAQVVEDWYDGVHMIRHFYAEAKDGLFKEVTMQTCKNEENFELMLIDTIKAYQKRGWEVIE